MLTHGVSTGTRVWVPSIHMNMVTGAYGYTYQC